MKKSLSRSLLLFWEKVLSAFVQKADEGNAAQLTPLTPSLSQNWRGGLTISTVLKNINTQLQSFSDAPHLDAQRIILHAVDQRDASYLLAHSDDILSKAQIAKITHMAEQRKTGIPLAYILGEADFYGRTFIVTPDVLIPRPDTEELIDKALEFIQKRHPRHDRGSTSNDDTWIPAFAGMTREKEILIADICTGSGVIAITLALEIASLKANATKSYKLIATDISPSALTIANQNAEKHGVLDRIEFIQGDMFKELNGGKIDLIVSNPPYIPTREITSLRSRLGGRSNLASPNTNKIARSPSAPRNDNSVSTRGLLFEPKMALDGGPDGLQFVHQITAYAKTNNIPAIIETVGGEITEIGL